MVWGTEELVRDASPAFNTADPGDNYPDDVPAGRVPEPLVYYGEMTTNENPILSNELTGQSAACYKFYDPGLGYYMYAYEGLHQQAILILDDANSNYPLKVTASTDYRYMYHS